MSPPPPAPKPRFSREPRRPPGDDAVAGLFVSVMVSMIAVPILVPLALILNALLARWLPSPVPEASSFIAGWIAWLGVVYAVWRVPV